MFSTSRTISGASPSEGSSSISRRGRAISARPMASICRSPPDSVEAICARRSCMRGNSLNTSAMRSFWSRWPRRQRAKPPSSRLSSTDISPNSSRFSGTRPTPASTMASTLGRATGCPPSLSVPVEPSRPMMAFSSVDLPAPLGPMTVTISPSPTVSATWCTASTGP